MSVLKEIEAERQRQIDKGFDAKHDDQHVGGELAESAAFLTMPGVFLASDQVLECATRVLGRHPRRRCLVVAAAMLVAEIERLDRAI